MTGQIIIGIIVAVLAAALIARIWNETGGRKRSGHAGTRSHHAAPGVVAAPAATVHHDHGHDDHAHDDHHKESPFAMNFNLKGKAGWIVAGLLFAVGLAIILGTVLLGKASPSPGTVADFLHRYWLWLILGGFAIFVGAKALGGGSKPLEGAIRVIAVFLVVLALFGPALDGGKSRGQGTQRAHAGQAAPQAPTRAPILTKWGGVEIVPAGNNWLWIEGAPGHTIRPCPVEIDPNCDATDLSLLMKVARLRCRIGTTVFDYESGRCIGQHTFGIQSKGKPFGILYYDVPNREAYATTQVAEAPAEPEQTQVSAPVSVPTPEEAFAPEPSTFGHALNEYEELSN